MFKSISRRITMLIVAVVSIFSIVGVSATWQFATGSVHTVSTKVSVSTFPWTGSDILPEDNEGNNHRLLIENLINGKTADGTGIGLNAPNSQLNEQLETRQNWGRTTFGSMDVWTGEQYESLFGLNDQSVNLTFLIYSPKNQPNVKYIYTTGVELGTSGLWNSSGFTYPVGTRIYPIYRTKLNGVVVGKQNGEDVYEWTAETTVLGSAQSARYENTYAGSSVVYTPAFNPTTFAPLSEEDCESGESAVLVGNNVDNAIFTYVGQTLSGEVPSKDLVIHFTLTPKNNGVVTITPTAESKGMVVEVHSKKNLNSLVSTTNANGVTTFTATSNTAYYFTVTGSEKIEFTIS